MTPILNGNSSIHAIRLKLKRDPFPSKLCSHIPSQMDPSRPPGENVDSFDHNAAFWFPLSKWHRLMKREPVRLGDQSLQTCFMAVLFKIRSVNVFLVFIFTANWVL